MAYSCDSKSGVNKALALLTFHLLDTSAFGLPTSKDADVAIRVSVGRFYSIKKLILC